MKISSFLLDLFFPHYCSHCGKTGELLCADCALAWEQENRRAVNMCPSIDCGQITNGRFCGRHQNPYLDGIIKVSSYHNPITREIIHNYKYYSVKDIGAILAKKMLNNLRERFGKKEIVIVPVPLHKNRAIFRGYNQAVVIGRELAHLAGWTFADILIRSKKTAAQAEIDNNDARKENVKNAFVLMKINKEMREQLRKSLVIIVDDIATTGSTIKECAKPLKKIKIPEIWGAVIA